MTAQITPPWLRKGYRTPILAVDPGPVKSGYVWFDGAVQESGTYPNHEILELVTDPLPTIAIERFEARGMAIADESILTILWTGRFWQAARRPDEVLLVTRRAVKLTLCGTTTAKDPNVRQALIDLLGPKGTRAEPGPTFGVSGDAWAALGVAVTAAGMETGREGPVKAPSIAVDTPESQTGRVR